MFNNLTVKDVKVSWGALARTLRNREDLTQEQLAEKLGMSRLTIQNLEAGKNPTIDTLLKVLQHFGLLESLNTYIASEIDDHNQPSLY